MKTILLIEDNQEVRENTAEILELADYKVLTAPNGKVGVELAKKAIPDLIICDIMMPELDGFGVLHVLSKNPATANIPFIFLTAKAEKADYRKGMNLGADDYLTKPFDDSELLDAIETRLKKSHRRNEEVKNEGGKENNQTGSKETMTLESFLSDARKISTYKKKQIIFLENNFPNVLYHIRKGKVKTYKTNTEGREYITGFYKEGDFLGYIDLLQETPYSESAMTLEDTEIAIIQKQDFLSLLTNNSEVANKFIKILANNLAEKEERLLKLAYDSVRKRVAEALLLLYQKYNTAENKASSSKQSNETPFTISISREDLSNVVGASTETVIRTLSDFKEERLIEMTGSKISILDYGRLVKMKN